MGWVTALTALKVAPLHSGIYKIGIQRKSYVETLYIGVTRTGGSLRETLLRLFAGIEGDERLMNFVSASWNKKYLLVDWDSNIFPKDDINDVLRICIATNRRVPEYNKRDPFYQFEENKEPYIIKEWNMMNPSNF